MKSTVLQFVPCSTPLEYWNVLTQKFSQVLGELRKYLSGKTQQVEHELLRKMKGVVQKIVIEFIPW